MTLPFLIAGIILRATSGWFAGQQTVGLVLLLVGAIGLAIQLLLFIGIVGAGASATRRRW